MSQTIRLKTPLTDADVEKLKAGDKVLSTGDVGGLRASLLGLRVGLPREYFGEGLDTGVRTVVEAAVREIAGLGATVSEVSLPNSRLAIPVYYVVAPAECSSNLSRYDGVRFGYRCAAPRNLEDLYKRSRSEGFGAEVQRRIMIGTYALSAGYYDAYYLKAQQVRRLIAEDYRRAFEQVDVIAGPTSPTTAFRLGEKTSDPVTMYLSDIYTIAVNLAGLPAIALPAGPPSARRVSCPGSSSIARSAQSLNTAI